LLESENKVRPHSHLQLWSFSGSIKDQAVALHIAMCQLQQQPDFATLQSM